jgi:hypothetical protein
VVNAIKAYSKNPDIDVLELMQDYIQGPDFPTGGMILGKAGIRSAYQTGTGSLVIRSKVDIQEFENGKKRMVSGDAYIGFVKFPKDGSLPLIETVNTFGASSNPDSPHFADQRALYQAQKTKKMTLDKVEVLKTAEKIYHPK